MKDGAPLVLDEPVLQKGPKQSEMRYRQSTNRSGRYLARLFRIGFVSTKPRYGTGEVVAAPCHLLKEASHRIASGIILSLCLLLLPWYLASQRAVSKPSRGHSQGVCYGHLTLADCCSVRSDFEGMVWCRTQYIFTSLYALYESSLTVVAKVCIEIRPFVSIRRTKDDVKVLCCWLPDLDRR